MLGVFLQRGSLLRCRDFLGFATCQRPAVYELCAISVAGGSPCQDVSVLNKMRKGLAAERTQLFYHIPRAAHECRELLTHLDIQMPVLQLLENVSHGPTEVTRAMDEAMLGLPVTVHAGSFGWVKRTRCFWGSDGQTAMSAVNLQPPKHAKLEWHNGTCHGMWCGKKPFPESVIFRDRFMNALEPKQDLGNMQPQQIFATFTRAFDHPEVPDVKASAEARQRYLEDGRTFPAFAYESHSLLWKQSKWRKLSASERAEIMAIPASVLSWVDAASEAGESQGILGGKLVPRAVSDACTCCFSS